MALLVSFSGFKGSGKDTAALLMRSKMPFESLSFAAPLKEALAAMFGWPRELLDGTTLESRAWRETPDIYWSDQFGHTVTPRFVLQHFGTDVVRQHMLDNFWIAAVQKQIENSSSNIILTDARFPNELDMVRKLGGITVRIKRGEEPWWYQPSARLNRLPRWLAKVVLLFWPKLRQVHISERAWIGYPFDFEIENNGSLADLEQKIELLLQKVAKPPV